MKSSAILGLLLTVSSAVSAAPIDYFPLHDGASWTYATRYSDAPNGASYTRTVTETTDGLVHVSNSKGKQKLEGDYYRKGADGSVIEEQAIEGTSVAEYKPPQIVVPAQPKVASRWTWSGQGLYMEHLELKFEVVGFDTVTVPAGTYKAALHIRMVEGKDQRIVDEWFAPDVGNVKNVIVLDGSKTITTLELTAYTPGR